MGEVKREHSLRLWAQAEGWWHWKIGPRRNRFEKEIDNIHQKSSTEYLSQISVKLNVSLFFQINSDEELIIFDTLKSLLQQQTCLLKCFESLKCGSLRGVYFTLRLTGLNHVIMSNGRKCKVFSHHWGK